MTRLLPIGCVSLLYFLGASRQCLAADLGTTPSDPFSYCSTIGNIDTPVGGASPTPVALEQYLRTALGLPANSAPAPEHYYWRCMDGAVYVCATGANIPCDAKADRAKRSRGAENYCRENRDAAVVPAYATGHATIYDWTCSAGRAVRGKQVAKVDARGYRADIWYRVSRE
jgi:hypothetical protein